MSVFEVYLGNGTKVNLGDEGIKLALLDTAEKVAEEIVKEKSVPKLRKYYQVIDGILRKLQFAQGEDLKKRAYWMEFYLLKAKVKYDYGRQNGGVGRTLSDLIGVIVDTCADDEEKLARAKVFLEAVVGFASEGKKKNK